MSTEDQNDVVLQSQERAQVKPEESEFNPSWQSNLTIQTNEDGNSFYGEEENLLRLLFPKSDKGN